MLLELACQKHISSTVNPHRLSLMSSAGLSHQNLNYQKSKKQPTLFGALPGMILTGAGAITSPWLIVLGALVIWKDLYSTVRIELQPRHAIALNAMWDNHDGRKRISEYDAEKFTNLALTKADINPLNTANFARVVDDLAKIGCVEIKSGEIWLREWIRRQWP